MKTKLLMAAMSAALLLASMQAQEAPQEAAPNASGGVATNWKQIAIPALPPFKPQGAQARGAAEWNDRIPDRES